MGPSCTTGTKVDIYGIKSRRRVHLFLALCKETGFKPSALFAVGMRYMVATEEGGDRVIYMRDSHRHCRRLCWTMQPELFSRRLKVMTLNSVQRCLCTPDARTMRVNL
jgi:hypothetical protein